MKLLHLYLKPMFRLIVISMTVLAVSPVISMSAGPQHKSPRGLIKSEYAAVSAEKRIDKFKEKIKSIENRVAFFKDELDWLELKIRKIRDDGREVSSVLEKSVRTKKEKINRLLKEKQRIEKHVQAVLKKSDSEKKGALLSHSLESSTKETFSFVDTKELLDQMSRKELDQWVTVSEQGTIVKLNTTLPILFSSGSARISKEYKPFLAKLADFLGPYDVKIIVDGYADPVPINTRMYPSNFELGAARAGGIVRELIKNGLAPSVFKIRSPGRYRFQAQGLSRQKSVERRAEITVLFSG